MLISDPKDIHVEKEIEEGTDRVCAVLGAAYLEEKLTTAIKTRLVQKDFDPAYNLARKKWLYTIGAIATLIVRYSEMPREVPGPIF